MAEIGNTAVKAAWAEGTTLGRTYRYQGEDVIGFISSLAEKERPDVLTVASVRTISGADAAELGSRCSHLIVMDPSHREILGRFGFPEWLTFDRAAALVAARHMFEGRSCLVFDFGTTLTMDCIGADGSYLDGIISPGCRTRFKALNRYSRELPLLDAPEVEPEKPASVEDSVTRGVISGIMFEIDGYIRFHDADIVIFTGGDAKYFAKRMKNPIFAVCNLVLMGLSLITKDYVETNLG